MTTLVSVQTGVVAPLGPRGVRSAFVKRPVAGPVEVTLAGLAGDEQADRRVHGGPDKAVYGYAAESYGTWRASHPHHGALWQPGGLGENLTTAGLCEHDVCIGDIVEIGTVVLQVTQPREPCATFAVRFADPALPKAMIANGLSGWYYRVLRPGHLAAHDRIRLVQNINPAWTISRMNRLMRSKAPLPSELGALHGLAESWRVRVGRRRALPPRQAGGSGPDAVD